MPNIFAAVVDWGTSSFRAWLLDRDGNPLASFNSPHGMAKIAQLEFSQQLERALKSLHAANDTPVLMCGMVGAAQGWIQAPYFETPAVLADIPTQAIRVPGIQRDVRILPGICQKQGGKWDVMRGEETLLFGCSLGSSSPKTICMPGTHSKWAHISNGVLTSFTTSMTGELFALLSEQSTLAAYTQHPTCDGNWQDFEEAIEEIIDSPQTILSKLFTIRAMPLLLQDDAKGGMTERLSGLLIGLEIKGMNLDPQNEITLVADGKLAERYERALSKFGIETTSVDANAMAQQGLFGAARKIWP